MFRKRLQLLLLAATAFLPMGNNAAEIIEWNGHEVYNDAVVAKLKEPAQAGALAAMGIPAEKIEPLGEQLPGLLVLEKPPTAGLQAMSAEQKAAELTTWIEELEASGRFEYVEPNFVMRLMRVPADAGFSNGSLWGLHNFGQSGGVAGVDINATNAWDISIGRTNVVVAVIDTGIRHTHRDLTAQMWVNPTEVPGNGADDDNDGFIDNLYGMDGVNNDGDPNDDNGHGTHVAGTIGAAADDGNPHVGVAWNVRLMGLKAGDADGLFPSIATLRCWDFAIQRRVQVINASYGGYAFSQAQYDAVRAARDAGILLVAAAGNDRNNNDSFPMYPASYDLDNIISVAAMDRAERLADFSNYGATTVDVAAPGVEIFSTYNGSDTDYETIQGTSMASPHVAGIAALVFGYLENASYSEVRDRILLGVVPVPTFEGMMVTGGRVDAFLALTRGVDGVLEVSIVPPSGSQLTIGTNQVFTVNVNDGLAVTNASVTMTGPGGTIQFRNDGTAPDEVSEDNQYTGSLLVPNSPGPLTYTLTVTAPGKDTYTETITYEAVARPDNDLFANARKVVAGGATYEQSTRFATIEAGEPRHANVTQVDSSVWYTWSLPQTSDVIVDTAGTAFDTVVAVYTGNNLQTLSEVVSANDVAGKRQAYVKFRAQAGVSYRIAIAGATSSDSGLLRVRFEINGEPDTVPPVVSITNPPSGFTVHHDQVEVRGTAFDPAPNASGVRDVIVQVNDGLGVQAAGTTDWVVRVLLEQGINVIRVTAFDFAENQSSEAQISVYYRPLETQNDLFGRAEILTGASGSVTGDNTGATKEFQEPNHAGSAGGSSVWYAYTPAADGVLFISTAGSSFDTLLGVYQGSRVGELTHLASNDDLPGGTMQSEVTVGVKGGQTYYIAVDGFDAATGTVRLTYNLNSGTTYALTATSTAGGSVSPGSGLFPLNATISVQATPDPYWEFANFRTPDGTIVSEENPYTIVIRGATNVVAHFTPRQFTDDFESGGFTRLPYQVNGWAVSQDVVSTGQFAARSTAGRDQNRVTNSLVVVTNLLQGVGSFEYRVSSEAGYDRLQFLVDGVLRGEWSGEHPWSTFEFEVFQSGLQRVEWRYVKDAALAVGLDAAFIDNVDLPIGQLPSTPPGVQIALAGAAREITITTVPSQTIVLQASTDLEQWTTAAVLTADSTGQVSYVDSSDAPYRFYRVRL